MKNICIWLNIAVFLLCAEISAMMTPAAGSLENQETNAEQPRVTEIVNPENPRVQVHTANQRIIRRGIAQERTRNAEWLRHTYARLGEFDRDNILENTREIFENTAEQGVQTEYTIENETNRANGSHFCRYLFTFTTGIGAGVGGVLFLLKTGKLVIFAGKILLVAAVL